MLCRSSRCLLHCADAGRWRDGRTVEPDEVVPFTPLPSIRLFVLVYRVDMVGGGVIVKSILHTASLALGFVSLGTSRVDPRPEVVVSRQGKAENMVPRPSESLGKKAANLDWTLGPQPPCVACQALPGFPWIKFLLPILTTMTRQWENFLLLAIPIFICLNVLTRNHPASLCISSTDITRTTMDTRSTYIM